MTPETTTSEPRKPVGNLTDFIDVKDKNDSVEIEVVVQNDGKVVIFHNRPFKTPISWFEY